MKHFMIAFMVFATLLIGSVSQVRADFEESHDACYWMQHARTQQSHWHDRCAWEMGWDYDYGDGYNNG